MAISAVLAIFMGGLGLGSYFLGRYAEQHRQPLKLYGYLEVGIAVAAFASPFLISLVRTLYIALGGSQSMGMFMATIIRLGLSGLVIGLPTFLMGGTLPALARAVETDTDTDRSDVGLLYGINTLGAVFGVLLAYFFMLEHFGTHATTWLASLLNCMVGIGALILARSFYSGEPGAEQKAIKEEPNAAEEGYTYNRSLILVAATVVGFVFLLMEIVWYRMLSPLLSGSTYTFGLILAVALLGIGIGGWLYSRRGLNAPVTLVGFAITCGLEAFFLAIPFALGDRIAIWTALMRPLGTIGFFGLVAAWFQTTALVVLPAAIVAGYQFPLLVALMGKGRKKVAQQTGYVYASNTAGSIFGSLAGGFGLLPLLSATGCWQLAIILLILLASGVLFYSLRCEALNRAAHTAAPVFIIVAILLLLSQGPTAAWRHSPIGAGWVNLTDKSANEMRLWLNEIRNNLIWEKEGLESMVGLDDNNGYTFVINGKADGNVRFDAPTQVMGPLVGAILHPDPQTAMVIGMGTGSSAGWLAEIPSIKLVDQVELEKAVFEVARRSGPVNNYVLDNPKVRNIIGDGREVILTTGEKYDLIFSEPSNPYRAGISSLYTREFYQSAAKRLNQGGIFSQWVQGYNLDARTVRIIYATLYSVFPVVEVWVTRSDDLLFVCSMDERPQSVEELRKRIDSEPFWSALLYGWSTVDLEGFLAHYVANPELARIMAATDLEDGLVNTDDRMLIEFSFARTLGKPGRKVINEFRQEAWSRKMHSPVWLDSSVDWKLVIDNSFLMLANMGFQVNSQGMTDDQQARNAAYNFFNRDQMAADQILQAWSRQNREPLYPLELAMLAEAYAEKGDSRALSLVNQLNKFHPVTAKVILARYHWRSGNSSLALDALKTALTNFRVYPWVQFRVMYRSFDLALEMVNTLPEKALELFELLSEPFCVKIHEYTRGVKLIQIASTLPPTQGIKALQQLEPHFPWNEGFLRYRMQVYQELNHSLAPLAQKELDAFLKHKQDSFFDDPRNR